MNDDDAFKLNSLHRFEKHSKLVLEAHSHCEVPAGCGGAVFQWVNPAQGATVRVHVLSPLRVEAASIDGRDLGGVGLRVLPGEHVLTLKLVLPKEPVPPSPWLLAYLELREPGAETYPEQRLAGGATRADGSWHLTTQAPPESWQTLAFDARGWTALIRRDRPGDGLDDWRRRNLARWIDEGSEPLAVPPTHAWLRKRFRVPGATR